MIAVATGLVVLAGCGAPRPPPMPERPTPAETRDFYGLGSGSCWNYRFSERGVPLEVVVTVRGPNDSVIAGQTVYIRSLPEQGVSGQPREWFLHTEEPGRVRLLRSTEGVGEQRVSWRFEPSVDLGATPEPPEFLDVTLGRTGEVSLEVGARFETETRPVRCQATGECAIAEAERHAWSVLSDDEMVSTPDGPKQAFSLQYLARGQTSLYTFVPGWGFQKFTDFDGTTYQVCNQRVCDSAGVCKGAESCEALTCP